MRTLAAVLSIFTALMFAAPAPAQGPSGGPHLQVGDPAPPLVLDRFVKGEAFDTFDEGTVYVVEFWATWCGPCKTSIPHLSKLQDQYEDDVRVLGVSIMEQNPAAVTPFVEDMGDKMDYAVATDKDDTMSRGWMDAAGQSGIPTAFIVDRKGRVAWIGHPMGMDEPLADVVSGEYDLDGVIAERERVASIRAEGEPIMARLRERFNARDVDGAIEAIDELLGLDGGVYAELGVAKFRLIAMQLNEWDRAYAFAEELIDEHMADNAEMLAAFAWYLLTDGSVTRKRPEIALRAAEKAVEVSGGTDADLLDTLALAHAENGDLPRAIVTQEKAVELATEAQVRLFTATLERYRRQFEESTG